MIIIGDDKLIKPCKEDFPREFEMKDLGLMHYFIGMEVWQGDGELFVSEGKYSNDILRRLHMKSSEHMETPLFVVVEATIYRNLVGSLMYLVNTRPDMCYAIN